MKSTLHSILVCASHNRKKLPSLYQNYPNPKALPRLKPEDPLQTIIPNAQLSYQISL